jgi:hypothetical protein
MSDVAIFTIISKEVAWHDSIPFTNRAIPHSPETSSRQSCPMPVNLFLPRRFSSRRFRLRLRMLEQDYRLCLRSSRQLQLSTDLQIKCRLTTDGF